ncbi:hypothetical protein GCM10011578_033160 [Streptomyces fuscichromogenes]|uniref:Uncharacterized protein n=1 Tax=Streptomyces fuscichromogenes TaxID=1324013 RepID=A0A917XCC4_9ACTN|nr:hypothetical protein GCM10011578_033160 [Streptomyces fuscichromogenes]
MGREAAAMAADPPPRIREATSGGVGVQGTGLHGGVLGLGEGRWDRAAAGVTDCPWRWVVCW